MATASVYVRWSDQDDGDKGRGGWALMGSGEASGASGIVDSTLHAERVAWKEAWGNAMKIRNAITTQIGTHAGATFEIKFWVDQQVCPTCQRWMIVEVLAHLKILHKIEGLEKLRWKVFAEVEHSVILSSEGGVTRSGRKHTRVRVGRETQWPVTVGNLKEWQDLLPLG